MLITCKRCETQKEDTEFHFRKDIQRHRPWCKRCLYDYQIARWRARKIKALELLGGNCSNCGYCKNLAAIDFHHVIPETKEYDWGHLSKRSWPDIVKELKKCIALCRNCHMELHHPEYCLSDTPENACRILEFARHQTLLTTGSCKQCGSDVYGTIFCSRECSALSQRRVIRPSKIELETELKTMTWVAMGKKYGVSDNTIKKWARGYKLL